MSEGADSSAQSLSPARAAIGPKRASIRDVAQVAALLGLLPFAALLPERHWLGFGRILGSPFRILATPAMRARRAAIARATADHPELGSPTGIDQTSLAHRIEGMLQLLRSWLPGGWNPQLQVAGSEHLERALEAGNGALLWVAPQIFSGLVVKKALSEAGHRVHHMSSSFHGLSRTRFGARFINPFSTRIEERVLAERIVKDAASTLTGTRVASRRLQKNAIVSISCVPLGTRLLRRKLLAAEMDFATGAPALSQLTGAPVLPVVASEPAPGVFHVRIGEPLADSGRAGRDAVEDMTSEFAEVVEAATLADPGTSTIWHTLA